MNKSTNVPTMNPGNQYGIVAEVGPRENTTQFLGSPFESNAKDGLSQ